MKYLKVMLLLVLAAAAGAGVFLLLTDEQPGLKVGGTISEKLRRQYQGFKADEINEKGISLVLDGKSYVLTGEKALRVSEELEVMVAGSLLNDIFRCRAAFQEGTAVAVSWDTRHDYSGLYGGEKTQTSLAMDEEGRVSLQEAAKALGFSFSWDEETRTVSLVSPVRDTQELPSAFDLRQEGRVPGVKDQGEQGSCWAFAAVAALESALMPGQNWNFSEENMISRNPFATGGNGGDFNMALAYLNSWLGPVMEYEDPYGDGISGQDLQAALHLQDAVIVNERDFDQIKSLVLHCGAVQCAMYSPSDMDQILTYYNEEHAAYYYPESRDCSHDMDIVGWDDDFPREYFTITPSADGAFICRNSWGEGFGEDGYFYISYEDPNIGLYAAAYTGIEAPDNYDRLYQSDLLGWTGSIGFDSPSASFASVYTAAGDEKLKGAGFYSTDPGTWYDIYLVTGFDGVQSFQERKLLQSGYLPDRGYFTIRLEGEEPLKKGERFALAVDIYTSKSEHPVAMEYAGGKLSGGADISDGESYVSSDGSTWTSMEDTQACNACLRAYTQQQ